MSRIDGLIAEHCPDGVPYVSLGDVGTIFGGLTGKSKDDFSNGNARFISYVNVFNNIAVDTSVDDFVTVAPGERQRELHRGDVLFTGSSENAAEVAMSAVVTVDVQEPLYLNSFSIGYRFQDPEAFDPDFTKHLFRSRTLRTQLIRTANGVTRFNVSKSRLAAVTIPVPPRAVQREIAATLDQMDQLETELEAKLEAELGARRRQYVHYRGELLTFSDDVPRKPLGEIAMIGTGRHDTKDAIPDGDYVFYARGRDPLRLDSFDFDERAIITAGDGVGVGKVFHFAEGRYALHQRAYRIVPGAGVDARYIYHYLVTDFARYLERISVHASVTSLRRPMFLKYPVAVPPLAEQRRIVGILDRFHTLVNDISIGLPAEQQARRKQYEHFRDRLLTFEEALA